MESAVVRTHAGGQSALLRDFSGIRLRLMTTELAPVQPPVAEEGPLKHRGSPDDPCGEETIRVIAALWDWAATRDRESWGSG